MSKRIAINKVWDLAGKIWQNPTIPSKKKTIIIEDYPGFAKTSGFETLGADIFGEENVWKVYFQGLEAADFMGIPAIMGDKAQFVEMEFSKRLTTAKVPTLIILDDIGQADPSIMNALMPVLESRMIGGRKIPEHVIFCGTTNPMGNSNVFSFSEALIDRTTYLQTYMPVAVWLDWAKRNGVNPYVVAVVERYPEQFFPGPSGFKELDGDGILDGKTPSARGLERLSETLKGADLGTGGIDLLRHICIGNLGTQAGNDMAQYLSVIKDLPTLSDIARDPKCVANLKVDLQFLLAVSLSMGMSKDTSKFAFRALGNMCAEARQSANNTLLTRDLSKLDSDELVWYQNQFLEEFSYTNG